MMKRFRLLHTSWMLVITILLMFVLQSCDDSIPPPSIVDPEPQNTQNPNSEFALIGRYLCTPNTVAFIVPPPLPDDPIQYVNINAYRVPGSTNEVAIAIDSLRLIRGEDHYSIKYQIVEERRKPGDWYVDTEFLPSPPERLTRVAVVLVLDVSESLGNEFDDIKNMAKEFISRVFQHSRFAVVGVVAFATDISVCEISDDPAIVNTFIDSTSSGRFTALYDAMLVGIGMLDSLSSGEVDEWALVTFTDGINNYGNATATMVKDSLGNIKSYVVGLKGEGNNINTDVLRYLADEGAFRIAYSLEDLKKVFTTFANAITEIYRIYYLRNDQTITEDDSCFIRFRFGITD